MDNFNNQTIENNSSENKLIKKSFDKISFRWVILFCVVLSILVSLLVSTLVFSIFYNLLPQVERSIVAEKIKDKFKEEAQKSAEKEQYLPQSSQELAVINVVKFASPGVVSIIVSKYVPIIEQYYINPFEGDEFFKQFFGESPFFQFQIPQYRQKGSQKQEVGGGTGFIVSADGLILTNKHVVYDEEAEYTVLTNDGKKYVAKVLARDPVQDLAILKIEANNLPVLKLGNSDNLQIGQTVIAIGNALGEFRNTVSVGVISGLQRAIQASGVGIGTERISQVIQTDAAINKGNSGGPLLNLKGEVIGINVAIVEGAQNIGFAIPVNIAKRTLESIKKFGKIIYPFLGVRYVMINKDVKEKNKLPVDYGALIAKGSMGEPAVISNSPAERAGFKEGDIILEINGIKIDEENYLGDVILKFNVGDEISVKILRNGQEMILKPILGERPTEK